MAFGKKKTEAQREKTDLISVGALWESKKEGSDSLIGGFDRDTSAFETAVETFGLAGLRLIVFPNNFKKGNAKAPDYKLFAAPKEEGRGAVNKSRQVIEKVPQDTEVVDTGKMPWEK